MPGQYNFDRENECTGLIGLFSIASAPSETRFIELHIGATPDNPYAWEVLERMRSEGRVEMTAPQGVAGYRASSERPLLLVAGGTGFSYAWSIASAHLESESHRPLVFYWGAKQQQDLYQHEALLALATRDERFSYRPVLESPPADWAFAKGWVHHAVLADFESLAELDVYIAGRFDMVKTARDDFYKKGLPKEQLMGDALSFID